MYRLFHSVSSLEQCILNALELVFFVIYIDLPGLYGGVIKWGNMKMKKPKPMVKTPHAQNAGFFREPAM